MSKPIVKQMLRNAKGFRKRQFPKKGQGATMLRSNRAEHLRSMSKEKRKSILKKGPIRS